MQDLGTAAEGGADGVFPGLTPKNQERLLAILATYLPETITADRVIEQKTGYTSEICRNMKADVLAHLAILGERQHDLNEDQQASQLAKIEEHLRRAIVEHPEEVVRDRLGDVEELWKEYQREAVPLRTANELPEAPRHKDLETVRQRIDVLMDAAREAKPDETTWEQSLTAAAEMTEAADLASELADKLHQCIGIAQRVNAGKRQQRDEGRRWRVGIAVAVALAALSLLGGYWLGKGSDSSSEARHSSARPHASAPQATRPGN